MKKLMSLLLCAAIINTSVMTVGAADEASRFIEYTPQYKVMTRFDNAVSAVRSGEDYALISFNNKETVKINGDILGYSNHVTRIYRDGKVVFRSDAGVEFLSIAGIYAKPIIGGRVAVQDKNFMYGMYNDKGEMLLPNEYTNIVYGIGPHVFLQSGSGWTEYDITQKSVVKQYDNVISSGDVYIICALNDKYGVMNYEGDLLLPFKYDRIGVSEDVILAYSGNTTSCYDTEGNVLFSDKIGICGSYSEGMFYNNTDNVHTYKSSAGSVEIDLSDTTDLQFGEPFHNGYAVINVAGKKTYIDVTGTRQTEQMWDNAFRFSNGFALVMNRRADTETGTYYNQWYIINEDFEIVKTLDYDVYVDAAYPASTDFSDGYIRTIDRDTRLVGFIRLDEFDFGGTSEVYTISGTITSSDGNTNITADDTVTIKLTNASNEYTETVVSSGRNNVVDYSIKDVVEGTYTLTVSKSNHVTREYVITVGGTAVTQDVKIHLLGDVNGDGRVTNIDYVRAYSHAKGTVALGEYEAKCADTAKNDGVVTTIDAVRIYAHVKGTSFLWK